jgi:hypothetical protein
MKYYKCIYNGEVVIIKTKRPFSEINFKAYCLTFVCELSPIQVAFEYRGYKKIKL